MNIFVLSLDPVIAARIHCDRHVVKMVLESAQLLSTAHRILDGIREAPNQKHWVLPDEREAVLYKATHVQHPCAIWVRQSSTNYTWLFKLFKALCDEYRYKYGRVHKCADMLDALKELPKHIPRGERTPFAQAMPVECKNLNAITAYRTYYTEHKRKMAVWTKRAQPEWFDIEMFEYSM